MAKKKSKSPKATGGKKREPNDSDSLPMFDRRMMEKMMQQMVGSLGARSHGGSPLEQAQEIVYQAVEAPTSREQVRLARKALSLSSDCAEAYVLLAENAPTAEEALEFYRQGMEAGGRALGPKAFKELEGDFWGFMETRPYMRARAGVAEVLTDLGRIEEAAEHYRELLELNPHDNQGNRYKLIGLLLGLDRREELAQLLETYGEDALAEIPFTRALLAFRTEGDTPNSRRLLTEAHQGNQHVIDYLTGNVPIPEELPSYVTMGGEDDAMDYAVNSRRHWIETPGAITWLRQVLQKPGGDIARRRAHREPSWAQQKRLLLEVPQDQKVTWQCDVLQTPPGDGDNASTAVIVAQPGGQPVLVAHWDAPSSEIDIGYMILEAILQPEFGEPLRPGRVEVRQKDFCKTWRAKLKQLKIDCELREELDAIDPLVDKLEQLVGTQQGLAGEDAKPEDLLSLPQEAGETWQADVREMPAWVTGEGAPYRPLTAMVVDSTNKLILAQELEGVQPGAGGVWQAIRQAMQGPLMGEGRRPGVVELIGQEVFAEVGPLLKRAGVRAVLRDELNDVDAILADLADHLGDIDAPPPLMDLPGMTVEQLRSFFEAAAEYFRRMPWRQVLGDEPIKAECDKFENGTWYAVVMGQSGMTLGLALYEHFRELKRLLSSHDPDEERAGMASALSLMYSEAFQIDPRDFDTAKKHKFPVGSPEAYPMVIRTNRGGAMRGPLAWELEMLEGFLRAIPDFLAAKVESQTMEVGTAKGPLTVRLSRVTV